MVDDVERTRPAAYQELADTVGRALAETYPGYRWHISPYPHPKLPFVVIRLEAGAAMFGSVVQPWKFYSASSLKKEIIMQGGELLARFNLNRRAFDETEFVSRAKTFAGIILPEGVDDWRQNRAAGA